MSQKKEIGTGIGTFAVVDSDPFQEGLCRSLWQTTLPSLTRTYGEAR